MTSIDSIVLPLSAIYRFACALIDISFAGTPYLYFVVYVLFNHVLGKSSDIFDEIAKFCNMSGTGI